MLTVFGCSYCLLQFICYICQDNVEGNVDSGVEIIRSKICYFCKGKVDCLLQFMYCICIDNVDL